MASCLIVEGSLSVFPHLKACAFPPPPLDGALLWDGGPFSGQCSLHSSESFSVDQDESN